MTPNLTWQLARLDSLPIRDWYEACVARIDVFVLEQNCPFQDHDGADFQSWHLLGWKTDGVTRELVAYCRIVDPGIKYAEPSIGRVVTPRAFRGAGYGRVLLAEALARHDALYPSLANRIGAQARLEKFYQDFGFETVSDIYIEDDIPHLEMLRPASMASTAQRRSEA